MADQRKVELILGIRTTGEADASKGIEGISLAAASLNDSLSQLERKDVLRELGQVTAQVAAETGDLDAAVGRLATELQAIGASEKEIRLVSKAFEQTTEQIERTAAAQAKSRAAQEKFGASMAADIDKTRAAQEKLGASMAKDIDKARIASEKLGEEQAFAAAKLRESATGATTLQKALATASRTDQIARLGAEFGNLAKKTKDVAGAVNQLNAQLKELGASDDEIRAAANAFAGAQGGGPSNRLGRIGSELRALPSTQLPGLGVSSDQVAGIIRLGGAISGISEKAAEASKLGQLLTPVLGQTAAGFASMTVAAAPFVIALGAIALAVKAFADQAAEEAAAINATIDAQRDVAQQIAEGLGTEEAKQQLDEINAKRKAEADLLARNQQIYTENIENQGALTGVLKATSGAEQALSDQIQKSKDLIEGYDTSTQALTNALDDGTLAANDAAEAEKRLAEERTKAVLTAADVAGKELAAQQKALDATEEQNTKRLDSIEDEKAVLQAQIDVLTESGDTSEEVTAKLAALNSQLGSLGKESDFIKTTALAASRAADAEKKAKKDAEDAAKKAESAQTQYTKSVESAGKSFTNSIQDIGTRFRNAIADNQTKFNRDLDDIGMKFRRDEYDLILKANRAERDAALDQQQDLLKIHKDANKDEQEALREGDFKALFLARQKTAESLQEEGQALDMRKQQRLQEEQDARADLLRSAQRQRSDRVQAYERQSVDARLANTREIDQARLTRQRALQVASEGLNAELRLLQGYWQQRLGLEKQGIEQSLALASGQGRTPANATSPATFKAVTKIVGMAIRR